MNNKIDLNKIYRIIRNVNCAVCGFGAFYSGLDSIRLLSWRSSCPYSIFAFVLFLLALIGINRLEKSSKSGKFLLIIGELFGAIAIAICNDTVMELIATLALFDSLLLLHILAFDWKTGRNQQKVVSVTGNNTENSRDSSIIHHEAEWISNDVSNNIVNMNQYTPNKVDFDIFISYRREDGREHARNIQLALMAKGYKRVFFDYDSIQKGVFSQRIIDAIYSCNDFILILSPKAMIRCNQTNDPVANEIRTAAKYHKNIIPVTIDNKEIIWPKLFPKDLQFIRELQFHDHKSDFYFYNSIDALCSKLTTILSE